MKRWLAAMQMRPLWFTQGKLRCDWLVQEDAVGGVEYDSQRVIELLHNTNLEDKALSERKRADLQSARFVPGPNSATRGGWPEVSPHGVSRDDECPIAFRG
jgi:hypothetical protein